MDTDNSATNMNTKQQTAKEKLIAQIEQNLKKALTSLVELEELFEINSDEN